MFIVYLFTEESTAKEIGELKDRLHSQTFAFCLAITMIQEVDLILTGPCRLFLLNNHDGSDNMRNCLGFILTFTDFILWNNRLSENGARLDKLSQRGAYCGYK